MFDLEKLKSDGYSKFVLEDYAIKKDLLKQVKITEPSISPRKKFFIMILRLRLILL